MNLDALRTLLRPLVAPEPLIWAEQGATRPAKPYTALNVIAAPRDRFPVQSEPSDTGETLIVSNSRYTVSVTFYGEGALDRAKVFCAKMRWNATAEASCAAGIALNSIASVVSATELLNSRTQYEDRAVVDIAVTIAEVIGENVGRIASVDILGAMGNIPARITAP